MRAPSALLLALILGLASPAAAVSLFGEVIAEDPTAIRPGEVLSIVLTLDVGSDEFSLFEGRFFVLGARLASVDDLSCSLCFPSPVSVSGNRTLASLTFLNTSGVASLLRFNLLAAMSSVLSVEILADEADLFVQKDTATGVEDVLRITERVPLELRSQGVSLGTSLAIVPEPATLLLLAIGLAGLALRRRRVA